jgi:hypothetical protein
MQIDSGVPIPKRTGRGKWQQLSDQMNVGDSVLLSTKEANTFRATLSNLGFKTVLRTENKDEGLVRVWKSEERNSDGA